MTLPKVHSGKVRDIYDAGDDLLLMVTSDRISAFDVVMTEPIAGKGQVLTGITAYWLSQFTDVPNHLVSTDPSQFPAEASALGDLTGRAMLVRRAGMLPVECIVRGYLAGSGWKEYTAAGTVCGIELPPGLQQSERLPEPLFTPSTKGEGLVHDENISFAEAVELAGKDTMEAVRELSLDLYTRGATVAEGRGIILADTKFEFGFIDGTLSLCDEVLTPDSSRFWDAESYQPGTSPPSFDKQPLRDWLEESGWDKTPPPPFLPYHVVRATQDRYVAAYERVTGMPFSSWTGRD